MTQMAKGLMWYEKGVSMEDRIASAALRYEEKFGRKPNTCHVCPEDVQDPIMVAGLDIVDDDQYIRENIVWVGVKA